jgi:hypothetical protein
MGPIIGFIVVDSSDDLEEIMISGLIVVAVTDFDSTMIVFKLFDKRDIFLNDTFNMLSISSDDEQEEMYDESEEEVDDSESSDDGDDERLKRTKMISINIKQTQNENDIRQHSLRL